MDLQKRLEIARKRLEEFDQQHLLRYVDELDTESKQSLLDQIDGLDLEQISRWVEEYVLKDSATDVPTDFEPAPYYSRSTDDPVEKEKIDRAEKIGRNLLRRGKLAAFVVAGGQGTRLGFDGPKGDFPISPVNNKTLFQIFAETIISASRKYETSIPWYIMTSEINHQATIEIFEKNRWFGLDENDVMIFTQDKNPNFGFDGKILLRDKGQIAFSPNGHGGSLKALFDSGATADMKKRGIDYISYFQVDNPLVRVIDPLFIGLHSVDNAEMSSKALQKAYPKEKVGNFCLVDGRVTVIEYSDLPDEMAEKKNPDGSLVFELGSIAIHIISRKFVEKLNDKGFALPIHRAVKKIPHIDENGDKIDPAKPNGVKLETFVFDALPMAGESIILRTEREEEFAPVKNAEGKDSPAVTRQMMVDRAAKWLESAGIEVPKNSDGKADCKLEISPLFALSAGDVQAKKEQIANIPAGSDIYIE